MKQILTLWVAAVGLTACGAESNSASERTSVAVPSTATEQATTVPIEPTSMPSSIIAEEPEPDPAEASDTTALADVGDERVAYGTAGRGFTVVGAPLGMAKAETRTIETTGIAGEQYVSQLFTTQSSQQISITRMFNFDVRAFEERMASEYCQERVELVGGIGCRFTDPSGATGLIWLLPDGSAMSVITSDVGQSDIVEIANQVEPS